MIVILVYVAQVVIPAHKKKNAQFLSDQEIVVDESELFKNLTTADQETLLRIDTFPKDYKVAW